MRSDPDGASVGFDPIGLWVAPGTTVRWVVEANVHTVTPYHPANGGHPLRIPERARPWDSDYLVEPGQSFAVHRTVQSTYDYLSLPHQAAAIVGRIIVGRPRGPGARDPGDELPPAARAALPSARRIMAERIVLFAGQRADAMVAGTLCLGSRQC